MIMAFSLIMESISSCFAIRVFNLRNIVFCEMLSVLKIIGDRIEWYVSFLPEKSTAEFVHGLFANQHVVIGNRAIGVAMDVVGVEVLSSVALEETMTFRVNSSICIREKRDNGVQYLSPLDKHYEEGLLKGLLARYESFYGHPLREMFLHLGLSC